MSRIFLSHSSTNDREAIALRQWLGKQNPRLANEIFLDLNPDVGIRTGERWADALRRANARCEAVICLLSTDWESSIECLTEYRVAETLNKRVFCARLEPDTGTKTAAWQWCDLFGDGAKTPIDIGDGDPVEFATPGLYRLRDGIRGAGIGADSFIWPIDDPTRAPYRGWDPFDPVDAGIFFGRDAQIIGALDAVYGMRKAKTKQWFVILGPSGAGKSSFLRAGLIPRLQGDDRDFLVLGIVRPRRDVLGGADGFAKALYAARQDKGLSDPAPGDIEAACRQHPELIRGLLVKLQRVAQRQLLERGEEAAPPTLVLPVDQAEELLSPEGKTQAQLFLRLVRDLVAPARGAPLDLIVAASIRSDRFEELQTRGELTDVGIEAFAELKPMPAQQFKEVITGPAERVTADGRPLELAPDLVDTLLDDCREGSDTLPLLSLMLSRLYEMYGVTGKITLAQYQQMGGLGHVVHSVIDAVLDPDDDVRRSQLESLRCAFIPWLATINPVNDQPMRRVAPWSEIPPESRPLIGGFVDKRLLVKDNRGGGVVVEVALESLLRQWDEIVGWLAEERENLRTADDVLRAATAWQASNRDQAWLLEGSRLAAAEALTRLPGYRELLVEAGDFLVAARQREQDRQAQKRQPSAAVGSSLSWLDRRWRLPRLRGHVVLCGLGYVGSVFLRHLREGATRVVVVEMDGTNPNIGLCRSMGVPVIVGDARQREILQTAGALRAGRVLAVAPDDVINTQIVATWREMPGRRSTGLACLARIADPELCMLLRVQEAQRGDELSVDFFNTDEVGARLLLEQFPIDTRCVQPHILVAHLDPLGVWLVYHAARAWYEDRIDPNVPLIVTVVDHEPEQRVEALLSQHPALDSVCRFIVFSLTAKDIARLGAQGLDPAPPPVSRAYVTANRDEQALQTALKLRRALDPAVPVVVALSQPQGMAGLISDVKTAGVLANFDVFPTLERVCTTEVLQGGSIELMAAALHNAGRGEQFEKGMPAPLWEGLDEPGKEAVRSQARDIPVKLRIVNCVIAPLSDWDAAAFTFTAEEVEALAIEEHDRWCRERRADGWTLAKFPDEPADAGQLMEQAKRRKKTPYLVPWEQLPPDVADFDRLSVRAIPAVLASAGLQVMRPYPSASLADNTNTATSG
jgi:hypothetical protein